MAVFCCFSGGFALRPIFDLAASRFGRFFDLAASRFGRDGTASCEKGYVGLIRPALRCFAAFVPSAVPCGSALRPIFDLAASRFGRDGTAS